MSRFRSHGKWPCTGFPEMLDGRVKDFTPQNPAVYSPRRTPEHLQQQERYPAPLIWWLLISIPSGNYRPPGVTEAEAIENDIGGPSMVRSAAKLRLLGGSS